ncbi:MAG: hypothetical protein ACXVY3_11615, partial [Gaiellaceae bacterium]
QPAARRRKDVSAIGRAHYAVVVAEVEFDLLGERVTLGEADVDWLLERARPQVGSSSALGELATMLALVRSGTPRRGPVVLQRADSRALRTLLLDHAPPSVGLERLRALLRMH